LPITIVNTSSAPDKIAGSTTGTMTVSLERPGDEPRLCAASSRWASKPEIAATVLM
jgi:hypothetical protein